MKYKFLNFLKQFYIYIVLLFIYIPLIIIILISFCGQNSKGNVNYNFNSFSFQNYSLLFFNNNFLTGLFGSLFVSLAVVPIVLIIAIITCFGIWKSKVIYRNSVILSSNFNIAIPDIITGVSLLLLFSSTIIPLGFNLGYITVVLAHISFGVPYAIVTIYPRMMKININHIYASRDLGYGAFKTFYKVIIPFLLPAIISAAFISISMSMDDFVITNLVNGSFQTIGTEIYSIRKGIKAWVITFGALMVIISIILIFIKLAYDLLKERKKNKKALWNTI